MQVPNIDNQPFMQVHDWTSDNHPPNTEWVTTIYIQYIVA